MKKVAKDLREYIPSQDEIDSIQRNEIYFVLDEILDTFNIGSMFRLADAVAAKKMYLCGKMETPPSSRIHKSAVGTEYWVPWIHKKNALTAIRELKKQGIFTIAIEQDETAVDFTKFDFSKIKKPVALILGHESKGVSKKALKEVDLIIELPMCGVNNSFNVWGSAAVIAFQMLRS